MNTDWRYTRYSLPRITDYQHSCQFVLDRSWQSVLATNRRYFTGQLYRRLGLQQENKLSVKISEGDLDRSGAKVVFCHDGFPVDSFSRPVVWQNSILDPEMAAAAGHTPFELQAERSLKRELFSYARTVLVSSTSEQLRLEHWFPELTGRITAIPFFLPHLPSALEHQALVRSPSDGYLRCLFVGNEARRKGLDRIYDALNNLPPAVKPFVRLTVISNFRDGAIGGSPPNVRFHRNVAAVEVLHEMTKHDVLLCPSRFESFGFVFVEAMSQGCVPIVPNWEVQREIVDYGSAGLIVEASQHSLRDHLIRLFEDRDHLSSLSANADSRYRNVYSPDVVAREYSRMLHKASEA